MKFGSWTYNGFKVNFMLQQDQGDTSTFIANGEWALLGNDGDEIYLTTISWKLLLYDYYFMSLKQYSFLILSLCENLSVFFFTGIYHKKHALASK